MKSKIIFFLSFLFINIFFLHGQKVIDGNQGYTLQQKYLTTIPYQEVKGKIIIDVIISGKNRKFILDTGAASTISENLYKELNPKLLGKVEVADQANIKDSLSIVSLSEIKINDLVFKDTPALVVSKTTKVLFDCFGVEGFVGSNLLRNSIVQFNSKDKTITIADNPSSLNLKKKYSNDMELSAIQSNPFIFISLRDGKNSAGEKILFDTGDDSLYTLSIDAYKHISKQVNVFQKLAESSGSYSVGLNGKADKSQNYIVNIPTLEVNKINFNNVTARTTYANTSRFGSDILKYGKVTLDYKNKRFYIEPFENSIEINLEKRPWTIDPIIENERAVVGIIWDKTLEGKINLGDQIMKFDDIDYQTLDFCGIVRSDNKVDKKEALLVLKDIKTGEIKNIKIKKL